MKIEMDEVFKNSAVQITRVNVIGGWLVQTVLHDHHGGVEMTSDFVADPHHEWKVER